MAPIELEVLWQGIDKDEHFTSVSSGVISK